MELLWKLQTTADWTPQWQRAGIRARGLESYVHGLYQGAWVTMVTGEADHDLVPHQDEQRKKGTTGALVFRGCLKFSLRDISRANS